jgi:hypothetical protein
MLLQLSPLQARVIGVLMEKEITTPDQYPLSLNALTLGCNQKSSRDPVMQLSESEVQNVLDELRAKNLLFEHQASGSRVVKYKHRFCNTQFSSWQFTSQQLALVCVLLLRGAQTPGELRTRTNRLAEFDNVNQVEAILMQLSDFNSEKLVVKLNPVPGKREPRFTHLFCPNQQTEASEQAPLTHANTNNHGSNVNTQASPAPADNSDLNNALSRISELEEKLEALTSQVSNMQETLDDLLS